MLVLGGGVAGLAAVQAAKNMGAVVKAFDVRPAVKEQIESLGGEFLEVDIQVSDQHDIAFRWYGIGKLLK